MNFYKKTFDEFLENVKKDPGPLLENP